MYRYSDFDQRMVDDRVRQLRSQIERHVRGELSEEELRPLRLQNGLYIQRHSPMLRVAIPYGMLSAQQLRKVAEVSRKYDRGYAHFTTRQNVQYNWFALEATPDMLADLATAQMHGVQTSGNCIRNTTTDPFAGVAPDEVVDPRVVCELIRQWSTFHPEFAYLPRKFKIAVNAAATDRAATAVHDIGLYLKLDSAGELVADVLIGGGLGRTPVVGSIIKHDLPIRHLLSYLDAALRVYNLHGRRDNKYKARIKILVRALGAEEFGRQVDAEWSFHKDGPQTITPEHFARIAAHFTSPAYATLADNPPAYAEPLARDRAFARWAERNVHAHKVPGYAAVVLSLKPTGVAPGDLTADQMDAVAQLADDHSFGELRVSHEQNLILADVPQQSLFALWHSLQAIGVATPNIGLLTDIICCPGGDFCSLANAKSIPIADAIQRRFDDLDFQHDIGDVTFNISGCINACGHHHVGNIGILGVDKHGDEFYQITLGGEVGETPQHTRIGTIIGPSLSAHEVPDAIGKVFDVYLSARDSEHERFIDVVRRIGTAPFKSAVYDGRATTSAEETADA